MDGEVVNLGNELIKRIHPGFSAAPVIRMPPVVSELFGVGERNTLAPIVNSFRLRPAGRIKASVEIVDIGLRDVDGEWVKGERAHI